MRTQFGIKFPDNLLSAIDRRCADEDYSRTYYLESLARADLKKRNIPIKPSKTEIIWDNIEDMPL